ncbi:hypothetical protein [Microcoleus sp. N3A4]
MATVLHQPGICCIYLDGTTPTITISEAASKFDSRMMQLKPDLTQPQ